MKGVPLSTCGAFSTFSPPPPALDRRRRRPVMHRRPPKRMERRASQAPVPLETGRPPRTIGAEGNRSLRHPRRQQRIRRMIWRRRLVALVPVWEPSMSSTRLPISPLPSSVSPVSPPLDLKINTFTFWFSSPFYGWPLFCSYKTND